MGTGRLQAFVLAGIAACTLAAAACSDPASPVRDAFRPGTYLLQTIGGQPLPYLLLELGGFEKRFLTVDSLVFADGLMFELSVVVYQRHTRPDSTVASPRPTGVAYVTVGDTVRPVGLNPLVYSNGTLRAITRVDVLGCAKPCELIWKRGS